MTVSTFVYQRGAPIRVDLVDDNGGFVGKSLSAKIKRAIGRACQAK